MKAAAGNLPNPRLLGQLLVLLSIFRDSWGSCATGAHTLRYDLTAWHVEGSGQPQFWALGYLDGELFLRYDGDSRTAEPWGLRMKGPVGAETWARETEELQEKEQQLRTMLAEVMAQKEQDRGFHTLQATLGCEVQGNSTGSFWRLGYNGQDFLTLDPETLTWKVAESLTQQTKVLWERHGPRAGLVKTFLYAVCPAALQRFLASLRNNLVETGTNRHREWELTAWDPGTQGNIYVALSPSFCWENPPKMSVTLRNFPVGRITLKCQAFNLDHPTATLTWLRDGEPAQQLTLGHEAMVPSGDGTYQTWVFTRTLPGEESRFTCHLQHCSHNTTVPADTGEELGELTPHFTWLNTGSGKAHCHIPTHFMVACRASSSRVGWCRQPGCCSGCFCSFSGVDVAELRLEEGGGLEESRGRRKTDPPFLASCVKQILHATRCSGARGNREEFHVKKNNQSQTLRRADRERDRDTLSL